MRLAGTAEDVRRELDALSARFGIAEFVIDTPAAATAQRLAPHPRRLVPLAGALATDLLRQAGTVAERQHLLRGGPGFGEGIVAVLLVDAQFGAYTGEVDVGGGEDALHSPNPREE